MSEIKCPNCGERIISINQYRECEHCGEQIPEYLVREMNNGTNPNNSNNTEMGRMFKSPYNHSDMSTNGSKDCFSTGSIIQELAVLIFILDIIGVIILAINDYDISVLIAGVLSGASFLAFFYGFGEIINRIISIDEGIKSIKNTKKN